MKVGLCWSGSKSHRNDLNRSLPRAALKPLAFIPGVDWYCLAKDEWDPALADLGMQNGLEGVVDWYDTALAVKKLDLVITVDTALLHLCGGVGSPVWGLIAAVPDMRWMLNRETTPWYSSVRLYRQQKAGDWSDVIERVAHDLRTLTLERAA